MQPAHLGIFTADLASFLIISCAIGKKKNITWFLVWYSIRYWLFFTQILTILYKNKLRSFWNPLFCIFCFVKSDFTNGFRAIYVLYLWIIFLKRHIFLTYASQGRPLVEVIVRLFLMIWHQSRTFHHNYWLLF